MKKGRKKRICGYQKASSHEKEEYLIILGLVLLATSLNRRQTKEMGQTVLNS